MRILMIKMQAEKKILVVFDDMIADIKSNKVVASHNRRIVY